MYEISKSTNLRSKNTNLMEVKMLKDSFILLVSFTGTFLMIIAASYYNFGF